MAGDKCIDRAILGESCVGVMEFSSSHCSSVCVCVCVPECYSDK